MFRRSFLLLAAIAVGSGGVPFVQADELPEDAARLVAEYEEDAEAVRKEAEAKIAGQRKELALKLKKLQDEYCRQAKLDEAVAIRDKIRMLSDPAVGARPDPGNAIGLAGDVGSKHHFKVTGRLDGSVYGTDVYTTDSSFGTAAVHAGVLKVGETGVVRVTILPGRNNYESSTRNGVTSYQWQSYPSSYKIERVRDTPLDLPKPPGAAEGTKPAAATPQPPER